MSISINKHFNKNNKMIEKIIKNLTIFVNNLQYSGSSITIKNNKVILIKNLLKMVKIQYLK